MIASYASFVLVIWFLVAEPMFEFAALLEFGVDWVALSAFAAAWARRGHSAAVRA